MTDLAGNRLRNIVSKTIDRSTPTFDIVISPVNSKEMYITFVKQIITDSAKIKLTDNSGNKIEIADNFMNILPDCFQLITINEDGTYEPCGTCTACIGVIHENLLEPFTKEGLERFQDYEENHEKEPERFRLKGF